MSEETKEMNRLFVKERVRGLTDVTSEQFERFYKRLFKLFPQDKNPIDYTREDFVKTITKFNLKQVNAYLTIKSQIKVYVEWMTLKGLMSKNQLSELVSIDYKEIDVSSAYLTYFFRDFNDLFLSLEDAIEIKLKGREEGGEFDGLRCAMYLAWYGFTAEELTKLKKTDIPRAESVVYRNGEPIRIDNKAMRIIREYADSGGYTSWHFKTHTMQMEYAKSDYLFRATRNIKLTVKQMVQISTSLNRIHEETGKIFRLKKLNLNGLYYKVRQDELKNGLLDGSDKKHLIELFDLTDSKVKESERGKMAFDMYRNYAEYRRVFYGE